MAPPRIPVKGRLLERAVFLENGCWIYGGSKTSDGYGVLGVGRGKQVRAHRASYEAFVGSGWKLADIAERFSVSFQYVSAISKGISRGTAKP